MRPYLLTLFYALFAFSTSCLAQSALLNNKTIPVLDKKTSYPSKKVELNKEISYVPLETSKDILLGEMTKLNYISSEKILISDWRRGDVYIFDHGGHILNKFNQKGGIGYTFITFLAYDECKNEVFILDRGRKKIFVFSEDGGLLRSFKTPQKTHIQEIYNFNDSTLLAFNENLLGSDEPSKPYLYIAKSDGKVTGFVNVSVAKTKPGKYTEDTENGSRSYIFTHNGIPNNCKFGNDFILANKSMDTVYLLKQDKTILPLFTQTPSVLSEHPTSASIGMISNEYLTICVSDNDIMEGVKHVKAGGRWRPKFNFYILDLKAGKFFKNGGGIPSVINVDIPRNQSAKLIQTLDLINANKKGKIKNETKKEVACKLSIGDNPVIEIQKIK